MGWGPSGCFLNRLNMAQIKKEMVAAWQPFSSLLQRYRLY